MELRVKEIRQQQNLTQMQVAAAANTTPATIIHIENGKRNPSLRMLERVAGALGVSVVDLLAPTNMPIGPPPGRERQEMAEKVHARSAEYRALAGRGVSPVEAEQQVDQARGLFDGYHGFSLGDSPDARALLVALQGLIDSATGMLDTAADNVVDLAERRRLRGRASEARTHCLGETG